MIWPGDYSSGSKKFVLEKIFSPRYFIAEFLCGLDSGIPLCCILYYSIIFRLHLIFKSLKVLNLFYLSGKIDNDKFFNKYNYHRCILCYLRNKIIEIKWNDRPDQHWFYRLGCYDKDIEREKRKSGEPTYLKLISGSVIDKIIFTLVYYHKTKEVQNE